jgi:cytoskeleton protein RodZ
VDADDRSPAPTTTLGRCLRTAREKAGQSIEQVSASTCIRATLVRELESDRLDSCGAPVYGRGHVRAIAHALGVDPAPLVEQFDRQSCTAPPVPSRAVPDQRTPGPARAAPLQVPVPAPVERRRPRWAGAGIVTLAVLVVLFVLGSSSAKSDLAAGADVAPVPSAAGASSPVVTAPAPAPPPAGARMGVRLSGGTSWISIRAPERVLFEGTVEDGWAQTFEHAERLTLRVGNAGAVRVSCGSPAGQPVGAMGAVERVVCTRDGLARP